MHRIFANKADISRTFIVDDEKEVHHAFAVLRLKEGDIVIAFNCEGVEILGVILEINKVKIAIAPQKFTQRKEVAYPEITLACSLPKRSKFDYIVEKVTELGVSKIIPLVTKRTEVHLDKEKESRKLKHWLSIAVSASKQSQRNTVPEISQVKTFKQALEGIEGYDLLLLPCLPGDRKNLKDILKDKSPDKILLFIGPEGDFAKEEIDFAKKKGAETVTLGDTVLRVDTAAIYAVSAVKALLSQES